MDPLPSIAKVFSYVVQQERQLASNNIMGNTSLINTTNTNSFNSRNLCTYCGKNNHTVDECYRKNGFPQNYASRRGRGSQSGFGRGNSIGRGSKLCTYCGVINHIVDECYRKHGYPLGHKFYKSQGPNINNVSAENEEGDNSAQNEDVKLTSQQYKALMALLQQKNTTHNNSHVNQIVAVSNIGSTLSITCSVSKTSQDRWILDSGATDHVTTFPHLFSLCKKINPIIVRLPNAHTVTVTHARKVQFSQLLYQEDVLYIPSFQFNLISISKLVFSLSCKLTFMNDKCFIQYLQSM